MRTRYSIINMMVNIGGQFLTMLLSFINRMVFIHCLSAAYLGVNGLFTDVLSILNFAELGIGTAMVFSMYEPAARDDERKLAQLMNLYKWMYRAVAATVLLFGLVLLPFLPHLIKGGEGIEHITLIYMMYVAASASSYLLNYKSSIYQAYQKSYLCTGWTLVCECIRTVVQIVALLLTGNFILYLAIQLVIQFIPNIMISRMVDKEFPYLKKYRELPDREERNGILKNIGAMSMHKLAIVIVRNTDSLLMSSFIGLATVGIYSNYRLVLNALNNLMTKVVTAFSGSVGNYENYIKPPLSPPGWLFPVVWAVLYLLMAIGMAMVWNADQAHAKPARNLYIVQLVVNLLWPFFFFRWEMWGFAVIWLLLLIALVMVMALRFEQISPKAAYLQIPYLIWLCFAAYLNIAIWLLNR